MYGNGPRVDQQMLSLKRDGATLVVELKRANCSNIGSAIVYRVGVTTEKLENGYKVELKPQSFTTYKQGLISFALPSFTESDLAAFLLTPVLHYRIEIDSEFNSESTFANFKRLHNRGPLQGRARSWSPARFSPSNSSCPTAGRTYCSSPRRSPTAMAAK